MVDDELFAGGLDEDAGFGGDEQGWTTPIERDNGETLDHGLLHDDAVGFCKAGEDEGAVAAEHARELGVVRNPLDEVDAVVEAELGDE